MLTLRSAKKCGTADYGWLKARYSFSFGHYFDPALMGFSYLQVLNQESLAPGSSFQPRSFPKIDVLNIILQGEAEYRSSDGQISRAGAGDALLLSANDNSIYQESNPCQQHALLRLQLWLNACPQQTAPPVQHRSLASDKQWVLIASPEGSDGSLQLRQNIWVHQLNYRQGESLPFRLQGTHCYLQSVSGELSLQGSQQSLSMACGDGALINDESEIYISAVSDGKLLIIDCLEEAQAA
ncbi:MULTISPECIES: pirin family protein [unclassified Tatumella]|uniref:pirin family protein n=1 Tax=unclassified Tatumella TaxID=2649542 RepID=UPI001BAEED3D|nr:MULTISPECIES: pirin family protein [unclassified Tatumella]MBS0876765.1 pirin family protein [Tatumella sp. JGM82]MBS0889810.1 pirin family protein [Tatumella sp. JGM94]MBS0901520.1 pirin family protein [Tatumella sp. JGM100]